MALVTLSRLVDGGITVILWGSMLHTRGAVAFAAMAFRSTAGITFADRPLGFRTKRSPFPSLATKGDPR